MSINDCGALRSGLRTMTTNILENATEDFSSMIVNASHIMDILNYLDIIEFNLKLAEKRLKKKRKKKK